MDQEPARRSLRLRELVVHAFALAVVLGVTTFLVWLLVGREAFQGGFVRVIAERGLLLYGLIAIASVVIGYAAGRGPWRHLDLSTVAVLTTLAWLTEGVILAMFGGMLADDLRSVQFRAIIWLTATGAVLQPVAFFVGAWIGMARASRGVGALQSGRERIEGEPS